MVLPRFAGIRPAAVVPCRTAADVAAALRRPGPFAVRGGGHCFAGRSSTTGVVIDIGPMTGVTVDGDRAVIGAGTRLAEVYDRLAAHGRTIPAGCGPTVGIAGLTLGGGLGILGRRHGLTCDSLLAAAVVLADGTLVEADEDLLWTLRGGGAPGVVTSLTFRTIPAPDSTAFSLIFPADGAVDVLEAWQALLPDLDDAIAPSLVITATGGPTSARASGAAPDGVTSVPVFEAAPDGVTSTRASGAAPAAAMSARVFGAAPDGGAVDGLIRGLGVAPVADERQHGTHRATKQWLAGDAAGDDRFAYLHSEYFRTAVPARELIERLVADPVPGEERELDFSPWGGAYNRVAAEAAAFPHRDARFLLKQTATVAPGASPGPWLDASHALTRPYGTGGAYPNFPEKGMPDEAFYLGNTERRRQIRTTYDPGAVFTAG